VGHFPREIRSLLRRVGLIVTLVTPDSIDTPRHRLKSKTDRFPHEKFERTGARFATNRTDWWAG